MIVSQDIEVSSEFSYIQLLLKEPQLNHLLRFLMKNKCFEIHHCDFIEVLGSNIKTMILFKRILLILIVIVLVYKRIIF